MLDALLDRQDLPDAFFCSSDITAVTLLLHLAARKIGVPSRVSVIAVDNIAFGRYCYPPLTTLDVPKWEMGAIAARMLLDMIADGSEAQGEIHRIVPAGRIVVRRSVRRKTPPAQPDSGKET